MKPVKTAVIGCREKFSLYYGDMIPPTPEERAKVPPEVMARLEKLKDVRWIVYLEWMDGYFIELFHEVDAHMDNPYHPAKFGYTHFSFVVDDIEVTPQLNCDYTWALWFHDPDGNRIEVHQYTKRSFELIGRN